MTHGPPTLRLLRGHLVRAAAREGVVAGVIRNGSRRAGGDGKGAQAGMSADQPALRHLAHVQQLGTIGRHQLAALVGIALISRDSGLMRGRRAIAGGRTLVWGVLYMAALNAIRRGSPFRPIYEQLTERGRPRKVALVAALRKLLVMLNAIVRDRTPWRPLTA